MLNNLGKVILASIIAFVFLTIFCIFYYNVPVQYAILDGATDYRWETNTFYSRGTEGFALGKTNNEGYINMFDYYENDKVDILIMGSSHMEAYQVGMNESTSGRLNKMLENNVVYNIGVSGHTFLICASNLLNATQKYKPQKYVIIETNKINFDDESLIKAINYKSKKSPSHSEGITDILRKNQFLRLCSKQLKSFLGNENVEAKMEVDIKNNNEFNSDLTNSLLNQMNKIAISSGIKLIIVYHPNITFTEEGSPVLSKDVEITDKFNELCEKNDIYFLDMSERFIKEYNEKYILPHGFSNTSIGTGHLNKYGHKMIAEELYKIVKEGE